MYYLLHHTRYVVRSNYLWWCNPLDAILLLHRTTLPTTDVLHRAYVLEMNDTFHRNIHHHAKHPTQAHEQVLL